MEQILNVQGMTCNHCKQAVESSVSQLDGVHSVVAVPSEDTVTVSFDESKVTVQDVTTTIEDQGYDVIV